MRSSRLCAVVLAAGVVAAEPGLGSWQDLPEEAMSAHHKAAAHWGLGQLDTAARELEALLSRQPGARPVAANLGLLRFEQRRYEDAGAVLDKALAAAPDSPRVNYLLARQRAAAGRAAEAEVLFQKALSLDPNEPAFPLRLSELYLDGGRVRDAERELRAVLRLRPDHASALNRLGRLLENQGKKTEADALLRRFASSGKRGAAASARCRYDEPAEPEPSSPALRTGRWLDVKAVGEEKGLPARVTVMAGRLVVRRKAGAKAVRFFLGAKGVADAVRVDWPDGRHSYRVEAGAGQTLVIKELDAHVW